MPCQSQSQAFSLFMTAPHLDQLLAFGRGWPNALPPVCYSPHPPPPCFGVLAGGWGGGGRGRRTPHSAPPPPRGLKRIALLDTRPADTRTDRPCFLLSPAALAPAPTTPTPHTHTSKHCVLLIIAYCVFLVVVVCFAFACYCLDQLPLVAPSPVYWP
jgi:hypothetical protein